MTTPTPDLQARLNAAQQVVDHARLLLDRLAAMRDSGMLSEPAAVAMDDWVQRLAQSLRAVPAVTPPTEE